MHEIDIEPNTHVKWKREGGGKKASLSGNRASPVRKTFQSIQLK